MRELNPRSLIQSLETLPIQLTRTNIIFYFLVHWIYVWKMVKFSIHTNKKYTFVLLTHETDFLDLNWTMLYLLLESWSSYFPNLRPIESWLTFQSILHSKKYPLEDVKDQAFIIQHGLLEFVYDRLNNSCMF